MRGRGLGRVADRGLHRRRAAAPGADRSAIHTTPFMPAARRMYEAIGFRRCPEFDIGTADMGLGDGDGGSRRSSPTGWT